MSYADAAHRAAAHHYNNQSTHSAQSPTVTHSSRPSTPHHANTHSTTTTPTTTSTTTTTARNHPTSEDSRISYRATVFEDAEYERIDITGTIVNQAGSQHVPVLTQLLRDGIITHDKFLEMYKGLMKADKEAVREFVAIVEKGGKGKLFRARGIVNGTGLGPNSMASNGSSPVTQTEQPSVAMYEREMEKLERKMGRIKAMGEKGLLKPKDVENQLDHLKEKMNELVEKMMELDD